jgi:peptidoglycan/xylan/chitin deacetylase (PgdA/CDA1 family)
LPFQLKTPFAHLGKTVVRTLLHDAGGLESIRYWNRRGFRILMYHRFPSSHPGQTEALAKQCRYMAGHYNLVSLTAIAQSLREGPPLPPNALAVTVDDGYRDFLNGYPVFKAYKIPATVFLVSGFLDKDLWMWWDQLAYLLDNSRRRSIQVSFALGEAPASFILETAEQRQGALAVITKLTKQMTKDERREFFRNLSQLLEVELPAQPPEHAAPLEWEDVRDLAEAGVEFGAHTVTHPVLSRIADPAELSLEIAESKRRIEEEMGRPVLHFSYPNGNRRDFNGETIRVLDDCRFQSAVTTEKGINGRDTNPYCLKRFGVEIGMPDNYFKEFLAGLHAG